MTNDLDRLSAREKAVLRLLARGHDAKSAADALGISVHAVNERLRDARRALGASSSREAARALAEAEAEAGAEGGQENRDEKIGLDGAAGRGANSEGQGRHGRARRRTVLLLGAAVMISLFAALLIHLQAAPSEPAPQPAVAAASPTYLLSFDIAAAGAPPMQPRLMVRAGEMASLARSGMGGSDFDISVVANPDPQHADHVMLAVNIVVPGSRQLRTSRTVSVGYGERARIELRPDGGGTPVVTLLASARPVAGRNTP